MNEPESSLLVESEEALGVTARTVLMIVRPLIVVLHVSDAPLVSLVNLIQSVCHCAVRARIEVVRRGRT